MGKEIPEPLTGDLAYKYNLTNEGGTDRKIRFLKNIMGLWMMQSVRRELNGVEYVEGKGRAATEKALAGLSGLKAPGEKWSFPDLIEEAKKAEGFASHVAENAPTEGNIRGSAAYRTHLIQGLVARSMNELGGM